jgi:thiol-disulfide isomerase/thioredoxin
MRLLGIGVLGVLALAPASWAADEPPGAPGATVDSPRARFEAIDKEYQQARDDYYAAVSKVTTYEERRKVSQSKFPKAEAYAPRMMAVADSAPGDPVAVDALVWVVNFPGQSKEANRAIERLARDHAQDPRVGAICRSLVYSRSPAAERLLRAIAAKNPDRAAQAQALLALAQRLKREVETARMAKQDKEMIARHKGRAEPERTEALPAKETDAQAKEAESLFEAVIEKFEDVNVGGYQGALATVARSELFEIRNLGIGKTVPEISGEDLDGRPMKLSDYRGKVVVLEFWGEWCVDCRGMYPQLRSLVKRLEGKPFAVVGINSDRDLEKLKERMKEEKITWPSWRDGYPGGPLGTAWNVHAWPTIYVLDDKGVVHYKDATGVFQAARGEALDAAVNLLLKEMGIDVEEGAASGPK